MDEDEIIKEIIQSNVVEKAYNDLASSPLQELSKVGTDIVKTARLLLFPLQIAATFQDRLERLLKEMNEKIPDKNKIEVPTEISAPAIESMRYLDENNILWKLFKEILFKSADCDKVAIVHPAFVQIIKNLSRDEAYLIFALHDNNFSLVDTLEYNAKENRFYNRVVESSDIPEDKLWSPKSINIYYSHLESLSLVSWPIIKQEPIIDNSGRQIGVRRHSKMELTTFGKLFAKACTPSDGDLFN